MYLLRRKDKYNLDKLIDTLQIWNTQLRSKDINNINLRF